MCTYTYVHVNIMYVSITSIIFWFDSLSLQTFCVVRSEYNSPEIMKLKEPRDIPTPLPSVSELSLKAEVKGTSNLPVLCYRSDAGQSLDRFHFTVSKKTHITLSNLHFLMFLMLNHL